MHELQLEAFAEAAGAILAQQRREWALEHAAFVAEQRALIAELRRENAELQAALKSVADESVREIATAIATLKNERGVGIAGITKDGGRLSFELDDGRVFDVGDITGSSGDRGPAGPDGPAGRDGRDGLPGVPGANGERGLDGKDGRDGKDGLGFDDLTVEHDGERRLTFRVARGDVVKEWTHIVPAQIYRGVHVDGAEHERGDTVTWGGSLYHCNETTTEKPGAGSKAWTLAVKRGQDGKDGKPGEKGERGPEGKAGKDLTQLGPDGQKW